MFIVNPNSQGGRTGKLWDKYKGIIESEFECPWDFRIADEIGLGQQYSQDAVNEGYSTIVGVGGEGTINEVVNGSYGILPDTKIGFIRSGTSNDFLSPRVYNWPKKIKTQLDCIQQGHTWMAPLVRVEGDYTRYALNLADTGISAMVSYESSIKHRLSWIRGGMRYFVLALLNVYKWHNIPAQIQLDDLVLEGDLTMLVAGFSKQLGDYLMLPQADLFNEQMAYLVVRDFSRLKIVRLMTKFKRGHHDASIEGIDMGFASTITIHGDSAPLFEVDGEPFSLSATSLTLSALPHSLPIIRHPDLTPASENSQ